MRKLLIIVLVVVCACSSTKEHTRFKFAKQEFTLQQPTLLRTDGVYLKTTSGVDYYGKSYSIYKFYRFYENGRCYISDLIRTSIFETLQDSILKSTDKKRGERTFFRNKDNNVIIESWWGYQVGYGYSYATVDSTSLIINAEKPRGFLAAKTDWGHFPDDFRYEFKPLNLSDKADW
ncbi:MAG: hypothetical protein LBR55_04325 [Bacteroidales bacterium]|jgi:hypothetical protein|nr:hypothetical protein [Bacteroidales bacterium]